MNDLRGVGVALVTPFNRDYSIDFDAFEKLIQHVSPHVDYLVIMGTTGEAAGLRSEEKAGLLAFLKKHNTHKLPIVYGLGGNSTHDLIAELADIDFTGIAAVLSVSPAYNLPSQEGIYRHYTLFADACPLPVILYNVPGRTASNITAETTLRLAGHPNIIGIKEASGNMVQSMRIAANKPADFMLISGDDLLTLPILSIGGVGVISVLANAFPKVFGNMVNEGLNRNLEAAQQSLFALLPINPLMYEEGNPVGIKAALQVLGVGNGVVRLPLVKASDALAARIHTETLALSAQ